MRQGDCQDSAIPLADGRRRQLARVPPRASVSTDYVPESQFDRTGIWFRTSRGWTAEYDNDSQWKRGPWTGG